VNVPEKPLPRFFPSLTSGDRNFANHGPAITVAAKRQLFESPSADTLVVVVRMKAHETQADWTAAAGQRSFNLYQAPTGCNIDRSSVGRGPFDSNGYLAKPLLANPYSLDAGDSDTVNKSFVRRYTVWDNRDGNDVGTYTSVQVWTRAFTIRLTT
jgi:hypothetical protein